MPLRLHTVNKTADRPNKRYHSCPTSSHTDSLSIPLVVTSRCRCVLAPPSSTSESSTSTPPSSTWPIPPQLSQRLNLSQRFSGRRLRSKRLCDQCLCSQRLFCSQRLLCGQRLYGRHDRAHVDPHSACIVARCPRCPISASSSGKNGCSDM